MTTTNQATANETFPETKKLGRGRPSVTGLPGKSQMLQIRVTPPAQMRAYKRIGPAAVRAFLDDGQAHRDRALSELERAQRAFDEAQLHLQLAEAAR